MRPSFSVLAGCVLLAVVTAAATGALAAGNNGGQAGEEVSGSGRTCAKVMGRLVCKRETATAAETAATAAPALLAARLFADGPQISPAGGSGHFAIQGFARDGWPVAVDFQPSPRSLTLLVVTPYGSEPSSPLGRVRKAVRDLAGSVRIVMDATGTGGRQQFVLPRLRLASAPGPGGGELGIATYSIVSYRLSAKGKPSIKRSPVEIFGFGAGPDAVTGGLAARPGRAPAVAAAALVLATAQPFPPEMALSQAVLANRATAVPGGPPGKRVDYQYRVGRSLHLVAEDIWRESGGKTTPVLLGPRRPNLPPKTTIKNFWTPTSATGSGRYRLVVRGWQQCPNGNFATCANQAAFGVARSAAVRIQ